VTYDIPQFSLERAVTQTPFVSHFCRQLTGLWPFYENEDDTVVQGKVSAGDRPFIDNRYQNRSWEERRLIDIMKRGWEHDPAKRLDIFEVVRLLRKPGRP
jgi:hypothetical protein